LPHWASRLAELLPARAAVRLRDGSVFLRMQRHTLRARPALRSELALRAFAPVHFGASIGVIPDGDGFFLIEAPLHGRRLDRAGSEMRYQQLTMLVWALHCAGHTPDDIELQRLLATESGLKLLAPPGRGDEARAAMTLAWARTFVTGRKATAGLRADRLAPLVLRVLGGESAAPAMLRAKLGGLPDPASWRAALRDELRLALGSEIPRILVAADADQAAALHALVCEAALDAGVAAGDGPAFARGEKTLRLLGPLSAELCERRLGRLSPSPTIAIVVGARNDVARALEHVGVIAEPVRVTPRGVFEWLQPLGLDASLAVEELVPAFERDPAGARQTMAALIERAGASSDDDGPRLAPGWDAHWREIRGRRNVLSVLQPEAARVANLLALSPGGLNAQAVAESNELGRGAALLEDIGLALRVDGVLRLAEGVRHQPADASTRRALLSWLSERDYLAPEPEPLLRDSWRIGLRLRAGDLACWHDDGAEQLLHKLAGRKLHQQALQLLEAHAAGSVRTPAGPPSVDALFLARDLGLAHWQPARVRRLFRMWLRNHDGEYRALALALRAYIERRIGGVNAYAASVRQAEALLPGLPRFAREQALIELAICVCNDDPDSALKYLQGVGRNPARNAAYLCESRILFVKAECEFVAVRAEGALAFLQEAREKLGARGNPVRRARLAGEIEVRQISAYSMTQFFRVDLSRLMEPLRAMQEECGCLGDLVSASVVSDRLMRMRLHEVGASTPEEIDSVLAEARIDNLRGYLIAVFQLEENALYRGDLGIARQLAARMKVLNRGGEHNHAVYSAWCRHEAVMAAAAGNWKRALRHWNGSRTWHMPEPWRFRTGLLRYGEWSFLLMLAGKYRKARGHARRVFQDAVAMSAGSRASPYFVISVCADLLTGHAVDADDRETLDSYVSKGYSLPRILKLVLDAVDGNLDWSSLLDRVLELDAPAFWKCSLLCVAGVLAGRGRAVQAEEIARAAKGLLEPEWGFLHDWLAKEFPGAASRSHELRTEALRALVDMHLPDEPGRSALAELAGVAVERAVDADGVAIQLGVNAPPLRLGQAGGRLDDALERALLGDSVSEQGVYAIGMRAPFGAIAARSRLEPGEVVPALQAIAQRLGEIHELGEARASREDRRRRAREAVRAAWALASGESAPADRLHALRALLIADTGAADAALALLRGGHELLTAGSLPRWGAEAAQPVDPSLRLRARISGGDPLALDESTRRAARAFASVLQQAPDRLRSELGRPGDDEALVVAGENLGASPASRRLFEELRRFADLELPIVVSGEPGCGKDLAVRALHAISSRAALPHVVIDCPTLRRETAASELFGHVRGAFTGASHDHAGLLERAGEGTLQLDGITDLDPAIQAMLLRAFQVRNFLPVGALRERELKARIVVTSEQPLPELVRQGLLREDLAQRLQGVQLRVPSLRERGDDALLFARETLERQARQLNRRLRFSRAAEKYIREHAWPGNVRELRAAAIRAAVMAAGEEVGVQDLQSPDIGAARGGLVLPADAAGMATSSRLILGTLRQLGEAQAGALARRLGLSRTTVSTGLSQLARAGFCERVGRGRSTRYKAL
jgi:DNA-binding NtrC family response regulator